STRSSGSLLRLGFSAGSEPLTPQSRTWAACPDEVPLSLLGAGRSLDGSLRVGRSSEPLRRGGGGGSSSSASSSSGSGGGAGRLEGGGGSFLAGAALLVGGLVLGGVA